MSKHDWSPDKPSQFAKQPTKEQNRNMKLRRDRRKSYREQRHQYWKRDHQKKQRDQVYDEEPSEYERKQKFQKHKNEKHPAYGSKNTIFHTAYCML